jgi:hypothetical protein
MAIGSVTLTMLQALPAKFGTNFIDKRQSLGWYILSRTQAMEFASLE